MVAVIQRVSEAYVKIKNEIVSEIKRGFLVLVCIEKQDSENDLQWMAKKIINLRIFQNQDGKFDYSLKDVNGEILIVSQFTLCGNVRKGNRPSFESAMKPMDANLMFEKFVKIMMEYNIKIKTGVFQEYMEIGLKNDGPVTIIIDTKKRVDK